MDVNKCIFSGRLYEDPEVKDIGDGKNLHVSVLPLNVTKKRIKK